MSYLSARARRSRQRFPARVRMSIGALVGVGLFTPSTFSAVAAARRAFDLPGGDAGATLKHFAAQSGEQLLYSPDDVSGVRTHPVHGDFMPILALEHMLKGTPLKARQDEKTKAIAITAIATPHAAPQSTASAASSPPRQPQKSSEETQKNMKRKNPIAIVAGWLALALAPADAAHGVEPSAVSKTLPDTASSEVIELSPFEVKADNFQGYDSAATNSLTGVRTEMQRVPITADVLSSQYLADLGVTDVLEALRDYTAGIGAPFRGGQGGDTNGALGGDEFEPSRFAIRGVRSGRTPRLDGFLETSSGTLDRFSTEATEIIRGSQSLLYGSNGASGLINYVSKKAQFGVNRAQVGFTIDDEGSLRGDLDMQRTLLKNLALRVAAVKHREKSWREEIGSESGGYYVDVVWRPIRRVTLRLMHLDLDKTFYQSFANTTYVNAMSPDHQKRLRLLVAQGRGGEFMDGRLTWENVDSIYGKYGNLRAFTQKNTVVTADGNLASWLDVRFQAGESHGDNRFTRIAAQTNLRPPSAAVPYWNVGARLNGNGTDEGDKGGEKGARLVFAARPKWGQGKMDNSLVFGAERKVFQASFTGYDYLLVDANGNFVVNEAQIDNAQAGRTLMPVQTWSVANGELSNSPWGDELSAYSFTNAAGVAQTFRLASRNVRGVVPATPDNPYGYNRAAGNVNFQELVADAAFFSMFTEWFGGRVSSMAGLRRDETAEDNKHVGQKSAFEANTYNLGAVYHVNDKVGLYIGKSTSFTPNSQFRVLVDGSSVPNSNGKSWEYGVKFKLPFWNATGTLAYFDQSLLNTHSTVTTGQQEAIDPNSFVNGRHLLKSVAYTFDQKVKGQEASFNAAPNRNWRIRFSYSYIDSKGNSRVSLPRYYNDQFRTNAAGHVLFNNGAIAMVRSNPAVTTSDLVPLTVAMMRTPGTGYTATIEQGTGRILDLGGRTLAALGLVDTAAGTTIGTGDTGLPISQHQLGWTPPTGAEQVMVAEGGEVLTGYARNSFSTSAVYTFSGELLKGFRVGGTLVGSWDNIGYYYFDSATGQRVLYMRPNRLQFGALVGYTKRFKQVTWSTQLNVSNLFNQQSVIFERNISTGNVESASLDASPRLFRWSHTFTF